MRSPSLPAVTIPADPSRRVVDEPTSRRASRADWDARADDYQAEHGTFLGDADLVWGPEGLRESDARLLGEAADLVGRTVLDLGCGAAQCARWARGQGAAAYGVDLSLRQLQHARRLDEATGLAVPVVQATATALPFATGAFDVVLSSYGALPFVADAAAVLAEVRRVLRPGGRLAFSVTHPVRWCFPDDPGVDGLRASEAYWDRTPYVELDEDGQVAYVEHHRTVGDWVGLVVGAGLLVRDLVEPRWPEGHEQTWAGWSPLRGRLLPGTLVVVADAPA